MASSFYVSSTPWFWMDFSRRSTEDSLVTVSLTQRLVRLIQLFETSSHRQPEHNSQIIETSPIFSLLKVGAKTHVCQPLLHFWRTLWGLKDASSNRSSESSLNVQRYGWKRQKFASLGEDLPPIWHLWCQLLDCLLISIFLLSTKGVPLSLKLGEYFSFSFKLKVKAKPVSGFWMVFPYLTWKETVWGFKTNRNQRTRWGTHYWPGRRIPEAKHSKTRRSASPGPSGRLQVAIAFSQISSRGCSKRKNN